MPQQHADLLDQSGQAVESTGDQSPARTKLFKLTAMIKDPARIRQVRRKVSQILFFVIIRSFLHPSCLFLHRTFLCVRFFPHSRLPSFRLLPFARLILHTVFPFPVTPLTHTHPNRIITLPALTKIPIFRPSGT